MTAAGQPRGTVTFLFSDIEGSTRLLQALGSRAYADVLERHRTLLREAFRARDGYEVECEGDQFFVAFQHAGDAVAAAAEAQQFLADEPWPGGCKLRVRIGLHSGESLLAPPKYVGLSVHTAARIMAAAHGGQIILSQAAVESCSADLPEDAVLSDLGEHELKDIPQPERLHQLVVPGLPHDFPPPRTLTTLAELPADPRRREVFRAMRRPAPALLALSVALLLLGPGRVTTSVISGTDVLYTTDADFARGTLVGVDTGARDQLGLTASGGKLRLLWLTRDFLPGDSSCTLVKIDTDTGAVLGEYPSVSEGDYCNSNEGWKFALIAVAPDGSAWHVRTDAEPEPCAPGCGSATDARNPRLGRARAVDQRAANRGPTQVGLEELGQCDDRNGNGMIDTSTGLGDIRPWPGRNSLVADAEDECILEHIDPSAYGVSGAQFLGVDRGSRLWLRDQNGRYLRFDPATDFGERVAGPMPCDADCRRHYGGRRAVTPDGDTWTGSPHLTTPGEGLRRNGGVLSDGNTWPTGIAVDAAGKVWIHEGYYNRARRVDPEAGPLACGGTGCGSGRRLLASDVTVSLPSTHQVMSIAGWMTAGLPRPGAAMAGTWTVVQDSSTPGRPWGTVTWNGEAHGSEPPGSGLTVEARAADAVADLAVRQYARVANGVPSGLAGRFIQVRVFFRRSAGGKTPVLSDIRIPVAGNSSPVAVGDSLTTPPGTTGTVDVLANDSDPDDDPLTVSDWTNGAHGSVACAGSCTFTPAAGHGGPDTFAYTVSDGHGGSATGTVSVTVRGR